jgi:hypothetical protein
MLRRTVPAALAIAMIGLTWTASPSANPPTAAAAGCIRFSATNFDAPGDDNQSANLNGEWVRIKNYCSTRKAIGDWKIHDYNRIHTYKFPAGLRIGAGNTITLYSGRGTNTSSKRYWGRSYGAVWNNDPPEYAYLRNGSGTLMSRTTEY